MAGRGCRIGARCDGRCEELVRPKQNKWPRNLRVIRASTEEQNRRRGSDKCATKKVNGTTLCDIGAPFQCRSVLSQQQQSVHGRARKGRGARSVLGVLGYAIPGSLSRLVVRPLVTLPRLDGGAVPAPDI